MPDRGRDDAPWLEVSTAQAKKTNMQRETEFVGVGLAGVYRSALRSVKREKRVEFERA